jgi:hypothetical protein
MRRLLKSLFTKKERPPKWSEAPTHEGWYVMFKRGSGMDVLYWSGGEDDPCFEPIKNAYYFGPFRLPAAP